MPIYQSRVCYSGHIKITFVCICQHRTIAFRCTNQQETLVVFVINHIDGSITRCIGYRRRVIINSTRSLSTKEFRNYRPNITCCDIVRLMTNLLVDINFASDKKVLLIAACAQKIAAEAARKMNFLSIICLVNGLRRKDSIKYLIHKLLDVFFASLKKIGWKICAFTVQM